MNKWSWFTFQAEGETSKQEKWAAVALAASVLFVGAMYTSARNRHAAAQAKAPKQQADTRPLNHLAGSASPYLLQHAHNPVDWYPWGPEALAKAAKENKPIFLSVGYSACHWCHVMEKEDFENDNIAHIMNANFVCIKVDREERPDIDDQYQLAVQIITGNGGWPMSVWLTPDLKPFHAGTYIPPTEFESVLNQVASLWTEKRSKITAQADLVVNRMRQAANLSLAKSPGAIPADIDKRAVTAILNDFDKTNGGFGDKPKFPEVPRLEYLLTRFRDTPRTDILAAVTTTLDSMNRGGIHDQLDGGFHRYSTDAKWQVPHFEKMLYDQSQLAEIYLDAGVVTKRSDYRDVATGILNFVLLEMTDPKSGGFYTSIDADSNGQEGSYYVWRRSEVEEALGKDSALQFDAAYGVAADGNYQDDMNVLHQAKPFTAAEQKALESLRIKLLAARSLRIPPATDKKIVSGLNGMMIEAMANAYTLTGDKRYRAAAEKAGDYIASVLMKPDGSLLRVVFDGAPGATPAFLEDYAYLGHGMMANYKAFHDERWLSRAELLINQMNKLYWKRGDYDGFVSPGPAGSPIASHADGEDNATPSPTGIAALDLLELASLPAGTKPRPAVEVDRLRSQAKLAVKAFSSMIVRVPEAFPSLLTANGLTAGK